MAFANARSRSMGDMNITPLVDVMLVLLVIFMVTVPATTFTNPLSMPGKSPPTDAVVPENVRLHLTGSGIVEWNGQPMTLDQLQARMDAAARAAGPDAMAQPMFKLFADDGADYELLTRVLARASNAGLVRIELVDAG